MAITSAQGKNALEEEVGLVKLYSLLERGNYIPHLNFRAK